MKDLSESVSLNRSILDAPVFLKLLTGWFNTRINGRDYAVGFKRFFIVDMFQKLCSQHLKSKRRGEISLSFTSIGDLTSSGPCHCLT